MAENKKVTKYNVVGFFKSVNAWCLICLGSSDLEYMQKSLEEIKANPKPYLSNPEDVVEYKLDAYEETGHEWWNLYGFN